MNSRSMRVLLVDADPQESGALQKRMGEVEGVEIVGAVFNRNAAISQAGELHPDVLVVDLMLPGIRSINLIRQLANDQPEIRMLALVPAEPPHDLVMLAAEAGALGFVCRDAELSELKAAIEQVYIGEPWLPLHQTFEVLQDGAGELTLSTRERRARLIEVLLGVIPLTGLVAAITAYLWRNYWGAIGVRVADLGIDPASRMIDVLVVFVTIIGAFGPLLFARPWVKAIGEWISGKPQLAERINRIRRLKLGNLKVGRLFINYWVAWVLMLAIILSITLFLVNFMPLISELVIGPAVAIILVANVLDLDDELPKFLHLPHLDSWRVVGFLGVILIAFLMTLGAEVLLIGPDLRPDGLHGFLAPKVLGFTAIPVMLYDVDETHEPLEALYLGGNADLYVLYDPCKETIMLIPVSLSRVELIDRVECRSP